MSSTGIDANAAGTQPAGGAGGAAAPASGTPATSLEHIRATFGGVVKVARWDLIDLAIVIGLALVSLGVGVAIFARYVSTKRETAMLEAVVKNAGDVERNLGLIENEIDVRRLELEASQRRVPADLKPDRVLRAIQAKAAELGLTMHNAEDAPWESRGATQALQTGDVSVIQYSRPIEVSGPFKEVLALVAAIEALEELVAVKALSIRVPDGGKRGTVHARLEAAVFRAMDKNAVSEASK